MNLIKIPYSNNLYAENPKSEVHLVMAWKFEQLIRTLFDNFFKTKMGPMKMDVIYKTENIVQDELNINLMQVLSTLTFEQFLEIILSQLTSYDGQIILTHHSMVNNFNLEVYYGESGIGKARVSELPIGRFLPFVIDPNSKLMSLLQGKLDYDWIFNTVEGKEFRRILIFELIDSGVNYIQNILCIDKPEELITNQIFRDTFQTMKVLSN